MKWAIANGYREDDPTLTLAAALPKNGTVRNHHKALPYSDVGSAIARVRASGAYWATVACFEFMTLTAVRSGEARMARWEEFDLETATWEIPGERMKTKRPHRVPLSKRALEILKEATRYADTSGLVFPSVTGKALSDSTVSKLLREKPYRLRPPWHAFHRSGSGPPSGPTNPVRCAKLALAHVNSDRV